MNGIIGMSQLLSETHLTKEQQEYAQIINTSGDALLTIINDILDYSKIEFGNVEIEKYDFELSKTIEDVIDVFAVKAGEKNIDLIYDIHLNVAKYIKSDGLRLRQILLNLVGNAIKFTEKGEIFIKVSEINTSLKSQIIQFEIIDTGIGIPENKIDKLFSPFSQLDSSTTRKYGGTGLGLTICKSLTHLLGGEINCKSNAIIGTTFTFTIEADLSKNQIIDNNFDFIFPKSILIIDDNLNVLNTLKNWLNKFDTKVQIASSGSEALEIIKKTKAFDLILVDYLMPLMNGYLFIQQLKGINDDFNVVLINYPANIIPKSVSSQFSSVLSKPIKKKHLFELLNTYKVEQINPVKDFKSSYSEDFSIQFPLNILVVEDNIINQKLILKILLKLGYQTSLANNGVEAVEMCNSKSFDLIFMDVLMPIMDGLEATRIIRRDLQHQPNIIAMTANAMPEDKEACLKSGMDNYISKPFNIPDLLKMLENYYHLRSKKEKY